jgi:hypothetical protein
MKNVLDLQPYKDSLYIVCVCMCVRNGSSFRIDCRSSAGEKKGKLLLFGLDRLKKILNLVK